MSEPRALIDITSKGLSAQVDPFGAELHVLRDARGRGLLWDGDPAFWTGRAPILFPIVGTLVDGQYRLDGKAYPLARHGFARRKLFNVRHVDASSAVFQLRADAETRASYPLDFELDVGFALSDATLTLEAVIRNLSEAPMPASFGFHPAFRWPLPFGHARSAHSIQFGEPEPAPVRRIDHHGLLQPQGEPTPVVGGRLALRDELFEADALIFDHIESRYLRYGADEGPALRIDFPDTPYLGVWTKPGAGFIAIEPWHGITDPAGFKGELWRKPGIFAVEPGQARRISMAVTVVESGLDSTFPAPPKWEQPMRRSPGA
jgi:galactose mutarotase-like enzyme